MRRLSNFLLVCSLLVFFAPPLWASHLDRDREIYEVFVQKLRLLPEEEQVEVCEMFLEKYPDSTYADEVLLYLMELEEILEEQAPTRCAPVCRAPGHLLSGAQVAAGRSALQKEPPLRYGSRLGVGTDFSFGALLGFPSLMLEYSLDPYFSVGGALRLPLFSMAQASLETRFYATPHAPLSAYGGLSLSSLQGEIDLLLRVIDPALPQTEAKSASVLGVFGGLQRITRSGQAMYIEGGYQWVDFLLKKKAPLSGASFPMISVGYRFFLSSKAFR